MSISDSDDLKLRLYITAELKFMAIKQYRDFLGHITFDKCYGTYRRQNLSETFIKIVL